MQFPLTAISLVSLLIFFSVHHQSKTANCSQIGKGCCIPVNDVKKGTWGFVFQLPTLPSDKGTKILFSLAKRHVPGSYRYSINHTGRAIAWWLFVFSGGRTICFFSNIVRPGRRKSFRKTIFKSKPCAMAKMLWGTVWKMGITSILLACGLRWCAALLSEFFT